MNNILNYIKILTTVGTYIIIVYVGVMLIFEKPPVYEANRYTTSAEVIELNKEGINYTMTIVSSDDRTYTFKITKKDFLNHKKDDIVEISVDNDHVELLEDR